jgi:hypothetical protein
MPCLLELVASPGALQDAQPWPGAQQQCPDQVCVVSHSWLLCVICVWHKESAHMNLLQAKCMSEGTLAVTHVV